MNKSFQIKRTVLICLLFIGRSLTTYLKSQENHSSNPKRSGLPQNQMPLSTTSDPGIEGPHDGIYFYTNHLFVRLQNHNLATQNAQ